MNAVKAGGWTAVRKDFVDPATRCHEHTAQAEHHGFGNGQAYILCDEQGLEHPFGEACARAVLADPAALTLVPDYTERDAGRQPAALLPEAAEPGGGGGLAPAAGAPRARARGASRAALQEEARRHALALRYLVLRVEKVAAVPRVQPTVRFAPLDDLYASYQRSGRLTAAQVGRILAIESSPTTPYKLKSVNLLDVYTAHTKLLWRIAQSRSVSEQRFLRGLEDWLARHLMLTPAQIESGGLALHPAAFLAPEPRAAQARLPDF